MADRGRRGAAGPRLRLGRRPPGHQPRPGERLALGYAPGAYDPASGAYTVRDADAHAWPELYMVGRAPPGD